MTRRPSFRDRLVREERGNALVLFVAFLPVFLALAIFAVDFANAWVHRRHLQTQADAAALAAAREIQFPCTESIIRPKVETVVNQYGGVLPEVPGATYNQQVGGSPFTSIHALVNSKAYFNQEDTDSTVSDTVCGGKMIDVKVTETDLPFFFRTPLTDISAFKFINARARVSLLQAESFGRLLPLGVENPEPKQAKAIFLDETLANPFSAPLAKSDLAKCATPVDGLIQFSSTGACADDGLPTPAGVKIDSPHVGVAIALGDNNPDCDSSGNGVGQARCLRVSSTRGLEHIRGWSEASAPGGTDNNPPIARNVFLTPGSCPDAYFIFASATCNVSIEARVDTETAVDPATEITLTPVVNGVKRPNLIYGTGNTWRSPAVLPVAKGAGGVDISIDWEQTDGKVDNKECKANTPCRGTFTEVQRPFSTTSTISGPLRLMDISEGGVSDVNTFPRCSSVRTDCTRQLTVTIGVRGLQNTSDPTDRCPDECEDLRESAAQSNNSLDCDPREPNVDREIAKGCEPIYKRKTSTTACPDPNDLRATQLANPAYEADCAAVQPGKVSSVGDAINDRINGGSRSVCNAPNRWGIPLDQLLSVPDPRIVHTFVVPFGATTTAGITVPVLDFATFYVTGWDSKIDPCKTDDAAEPAEVKGHFVKFVQPSNNEGSTGTQACNPDAFGACVAVLTE